MQIRDSISGRFKAGIDEHMGKYIKNNYHKIKTRDIAKILNLHECTIRLYRRKHTLIEPKISTSYRKKLNDMTSEELAYIAGLLDGEGNISINIFNNKLFYPRIYICNTHRGVIEFIKEKTGHGHIRMHMESKRLDANRKPSYNWGLTNMVTVREFLIKMLPYLIIKKERAELAIQFIDVRQKHITYSHCLKAGVFSLMLIHNIRIEQGIIAQAVRLCYSNLTLCQHGRSEISTCIQVSV